MPILADMVSLGVNLCLTTASYGVDSPGRYFNEKGNVRK
jgi:hypothetical protein